MSKKVTFLYTFFLSQSKRGGLNRPKVAMRRQEHQLDNLDLPLMLEMLLKELPSSVRNALLSIRVNAEKDTIVATRIHCSATMEKTLQPNQQHCWFYIRQD